MAERDQIRVVQVAAPTEDTPSQQVEMDLVAQAAQAERTRQKMENVAEVHRWFRKTGGRN